MIYTVPLGRAIASSAGTTSFYTAPATGTIVVRDITASAIGSGSNAVVQLFDSSGSHALIAVASSTAYTVYQWKGRQVLLPGDQLRLRLVDSLATWSVVATGYSLS